MGTFIPREGELDEGSGDVFIHCICIIKWLQLAVVCVGNADTSFRQTRSNNLPCWSLVSSSRAPGDPVMAATMSS